MVSPRRDEASAIDGCCAAAFDVLLAWPEPGTLIGPIRSFR